MQRAARHKTGSVVLDRRRKTWNFLEWVDGRRITRRIGTTKEFPTKGSACRAVTSLPARQAPAIKHTTLVNQLIADYRVEKMPERHSTRRAYEVWLRNYVVPRWGDCDLSELQARPVELWLQSLPLSPKSKSHVRGLLHVLWDYAQWRGDIDTQRNPMELVSVKGSSKRMRKPRSLTVAEFQSFVPHLPEPFRTVASLCACLGLRISEALALKWSDVNWLEGKLDIQRGIVKNRVDATKTPGSERSIAVALELLNTLSAWKQVTQFSHDDDWVFASPVNIGRLPWSCDTVLDWYHKASKVSGIENVTTHTMRHSYRSWMDSIGTAVGIQQRLMRHSDIRTTMSYGESDKEAMAVTNVRIAELALNNRNQPVNGLPADCKAS